MLVRTFQRDFRLPNPPPVKLRTGHSLEFVSVGCPYSPARIPEILPKNGGLDAQFPEHIGKADLILVRPFLVFLHPGLIEALDYRMVITTGNDSRGEQTCLSRESF